jgi:diguanylate cyclase (GGDEF)-like protein
LVSAGQLLLCHFSACRQRNYSLLKSKKMQFTRTLTLRQLLTLPYIFLVLLATLTIGYLSYRTGHEAVDTLSDYLLKETVGRISQAVDRHVAGSGAVLETAFPSGMSAPVSVESDIENLRTRFWLATSVHRDPNNYAYYGDKNGHFFGLWRYSQNEAELRLQTQAGQPRKIYQFSGIKGALSQAKSETAIYDARKRPWFEAGQGTSSQTWTSIYVDYKTLELVGTRARRVNNAAGEFAGVVATDLSLKHLSTFLRQLKLSPNGFAIIVEPDGNLIAASRGPHLTKGVGENNRRLNAASSDDPLIVATYSAVQTLMSKRNAAVNPQTAVFSGPDGGDVQVGYARVQDNAGLDWVIAVAVPREDFLSGITANVKRTIWLALLVCLLIIATGYLVLATVTRDLRKLTQLTRDVGDGTLESPVNMARNDELGDLAKSFAQMQKRLMTDRLTGLGNREALMRRIEDTIILRRRNADPRLFAVLFVDLNRFKAINDNYGHDAGDQVLHEISERMRLTVRATDFVARYAGDEFIIMLDQIENKETAEKISAKLQEQLAKPLTLDLTDHSTTVVTGAAIGVACYPTDGQDVSALIKFADADMYRNKKRDNSG